MAVNTEKIMTSSSGLSHHRSVTTNPWATIIIIRIRNEQHSGIYDLGNFCTHATLNLVEDGSHALNFTITNPSSMFSRLFLPMDRVICIG